MPAAAKFEQERQELACVLASGIFNRAPSLATLLSYICEKYFEGASGQIKEYNIAVEALGRPAEFDQKRDSIVRVEAHRLRKRLKEYYETAGSGRPIRIVVPPGQYAPRFQLQTLPELPELPEKVLIKIGPISSRQMRTLERPAIEITTVAVKRVPARRVHAYAIVGVTLLLIAATIAAQLGIEHKRRPTSGFAEDPIPPGNEVRILAGATEPYTDRTGRTWESDRNYEGGSPFSHPTHPIFGTRDPLMYQSGRDGSFRYDIPLSAGTYELRLHFAETDFGDGNASGGGETSRLFNIFVNGKMLLEMIDVIADAGPNTVDIRVFKDIQPGKDGMLHLECRPVVNVAFLNAIEITPGIAGKLRPIRIVARDQAYVDRKGRTWSADRFFQGGQMVVRSETVSGAPDTGIYHGERFGNLTYSIPVAPGRYTLILHFAEAWFGPGKLQQGGAGSRSFDLLCNGAALTRGLDIFKEAGGADRALEKTFHGLESSPQGKLVLSFIPRRNYSCINAIEVLDDAEPIRQ